MKARLFMRVSITPTRFLTADKLYKKRQKDGQLVYLIFFVFCIINSQRKFDEKLLPTFKN